MPSIETGAAVGCSAGGGGVGRAMHATNAVEAIMRTSAMQRFIEPPDPADRPVSLTMLRIIRPGVDVREVG